MPSPPVSQPDVPSRTALGPLDAIVGDSELLWTYLTSPSITTFLCETDGTIRWAAPSAAVMLGHNPTALTGANVANLVDSADVDVVRAALHGSANGDTLCSRIHTGNGSQLWCDVDVHGGVHGGMPMLMVTLRDASARMRRSFWRKRCRRSALNLLRTPPAFRAEPPMWSSAITPWNICSNQRRRCANSAAFSNRTAD